MPSKTRDNRLRFFGRVGGLKSEPRKGWVMKLKMKHPESVADHSYRVALMGMVYSDSRGLDTEKVVKMALLHDLPEVIVGDSIPGERAPAKKRLLESAAMDEILSDVNPNLARRYRAIWEEYEEQVSPEARLVSQLDKVEMVFQASEYKKQDPRREVGEFVRSARTRVDDPELIKVIDSLS